jgi:hypothetical protein
MKNSAPVSLSDENLILDIYDASAQMLQFYAIKRLNRKLMIHDP